MHSRLADRDVPDDVRDRLAELARSRGQSLQAYLLALVTREADRANNIALLSRFADRTDGSRAESADSSDVAEQIRRMREERTDHLMRVINGERT